MTHNKIILMVSIVFLMISLSVYIKVSTLSDYFFIMTNFIVFGGIMWSLGRYFEGINENN